MIAAGIDVGGSKIEGQIYDRNWNLIATERLKTPKDYPGLVSALVKIVHECGALPVGISAAGLINPATGKALTANLPATGKALPAEVARRSGRSVTWVNDARALLLSEAVHGIDVDVKRLVGVVIGTGVSGGTLNNGRLCHGPSGVSGEFGHAAAPARVVMRYGLPIVECGCGRVGCVETLMSGPGLVRIAEAVGSKKNTAPQIAAERGKAWQIWCELAAEVLFNLTLSVDPDEFVLAGGLSKVPHLVDDLTQALERLQFEGFPTPRIRLARGGDAAGGLGAAYAAWQTEQDD